MSDYEKNSAPVYDSITKFREFVELRDLRPRTREAYVLYPVLLGRQAGADPASLGEEAVRAFCLGLRRERHYAGSSMALVRASLRTFFAGHLGTGKAWKLWEELRVRRTPALPTVLTREEVAQLLASVRADRCRTLLRLREGRRLEFPPACAAQGIPPRALLWLAESRCQGALRPRRRLARCAAAAVVRPGLFNPA